MIRFKVGNKIEVLSHCSDTDVTEWCDENAIHLDEVISVNDDSKLLWTKHIPYGISFDDVVLADDKTYIYWGYDD